MIAQKPHSVVLWQRARIGTVAVVRSPDARYMVQRNTKVSMLSRLRSMFSARPAAPAAALPDGQRAYAVGDIHGRADLFDALADAINADDAERGEAQTTVVLLGDLIDRGPDSAGVVARARSWQAMRSVRVLMGNHEEMFLDSLEKPEVLRHFLRYGGKETVLSYGVDEASYYAADLAETQALMRAAIPAGDIDFIRSFEDTITLGDFLFVHAGIVPDVPLEQQRTSDLRWIRSPFLEHSGSHGAVVVHGHTIFKRPDIRHNRIGIDTGAYETGVLTALGLEGQNRWLIEARAEDGAIRVSQRSIS